ncbi:MAG: ArsR family transcriptional regulator [Thermoplasmatales archaeon]|nr:ArsR family transcriptional regulator [Candidatus Thermoplasmatota archaeon]MCL6002654.1 ArsR family transcriptional regulator [Candidatus Thermoplasmatota archaeon]MDA8055933.1 ArsR family transcriptional regulator [Thermoplasmatales archaeon]
MTRKDQILDFVKKNPGHHFRGIQRALRVSTGVLQYHLSTLVKENDLIVRDINGTSCYFPSISFNEDQFKILSHLRNRVRNKILRVLLDGNPKPPSELKKELSVSSPTLSYHLALMTEDGILEKVLNEKGTSYRVKDIGLFKGLIIEYRESFADKLIQDFVELWSR